MNRRDFNKFIGLGCVVGFPDYVAIPEATQAVPEPAAGYAMKLFTPEHKILDMVVKHVGPEWGNLVFRGETNFTSAEQVRGVCIVRPDWEIVSSYNFWQVVPVYNGDTVKAQVGITWNPQATAEQILEATRQAPRGRTIRHGFEPSTLVGRKPSITRDDIEWDRSGNQSQFRSRRRSQL